MDLQHLVDQWLLWDKDQTTAAEIRSLWKSQSGSDYQSTIARAELENRLRSRIQFGTAGLRGRMQAGFAFMNCLTVIQASQGLAKYVVASSIASASPSILVGHDTRHNSARFARLAANAFRTAGIRVLMFEDYVPTPLIAFGVKTMSASAGIMITASHNPSQDNGYKVYQSNGAQINTPVDEDIAFQIAKNHEPWTGAWDESQHPFASIGLLEKVKNQYEECLLSRHHLTSLISPTAPPTIGGVYTPMHGVGWAYVAHVALTVNNSKFVPVSAQIQPDPDFPTIKFPNPEEDGALQLGFDTADNSEQQIVFANDPDADRFAVAQKVDGTWRRLTGDQVGVLLADYLIEMELETHNERQTVMLCSAVSSRMLQRMINAAGPRFRFEETLTGFKWIGNRAQQLESDGYVPLFGYEEALGYMFPDVSWDKDGIAALSTFLCARIHWQESGLDVWSKLQQLYQKYGYHESINTYFISPDPAYTKQVFAKIRDSKGMSQASLGSYKIAGWRDVTNGTQFGEWDSMLPTDRHSEMLKFHLLEPETFAAMGVQPGKRFDDEASETVFTLRASGTEPKVKLYLECSSRSQEKAGYHAAQVFAAIMKEWISPFGAELKHNGPATSSSNRAITVAVV